MNYIRVSRDYAMAARESQETFYMPPGASAPKPVDNLKRFPKNSEFFVLAHINNDNVEHITSLVKQIKKLEEELAGYKLQALLDDQALNSIGSDRSMHVNFPTLDLLVKHVNKVEPTIDFKTYTHSSEDVKKVLRPKEIAMEVVPDVKEAAAYVLAKNYLITDPLEYLTQVTDDKELASNIIMSLNGSLTENRITEIFAAKMEVPYMEAVKCYTLFAKCLNGVVVKEAAKTLSMSVEDFDKAVKEATILKASKSVTIKTD